MKTIFPALAKRALSFALALVLLLSLCPVIPLTANAAHSGTWTYKSGYDWITGSFNATDADLVYHDDQAYDWTVTIKPTKSPPPTASVKAYIKDSIGVQVGDVYNGSVSGMGQNIESTLCSYSDFPALSTDLCGYFTLTVELNIGTTNYATLTQTFSRVNVELTPISHSKRDMIFTYADPIDIQLNITRTNGTIEDLTANITINDENGRAVCSNTSYGLPNLPNMCLPLKDLVEAVANITSAGKYVVDIVLKGEDNTDKYRDTFSFDVVPMNAPTAFLNDAVYQQGKTGMIFTQDDNPLKLSLYYPDGVDQKFTVKYSGTCNGESLEDKTFTIPASGGMILNSTDFLKYGIYEDLQITVLGPDSEKILTSDTYSFSLVLSSAAPGSIEVLNINDHFTEKKGDAESKLTLAAQTGANMWRSCIPWASVEASAGNFDMPDEVDTVMKKTKELGMTTLIILAYENNAVHPFEGTAWVSAYADYCNFIATYMAKYYPDQVVGFEIWNEWNHSTMSKVPAKYRNGTNYAQVVKAASEKIRQVNADYGTNFMVIGGATAGDGYLDGTAAGKNVNKFMNDFFNVSGILNAIDGFSFHSYASEEVTSGDDETQGIRRFKTISPTEHEFEAIFDSVKARLNGAKKEIWLTETGWRTNTGEESITDSDGTTHITTGVTEQEAAAYMVQLYTWTIADGTVDRIFWYDLMNDLDDNGNWDTNSTECNYGLIHNWNNSGNQPLAYSAKLGYVAMCAMSSMLGGATSWSDVDLGNNNVAAYRFTNKDGQTMVVAWTIGGINAADKVTKTLSCSSGMTVTDMYGNTTSNLTEVTLTECPIYIACNPDNLTVN